MTKIKWIDQRKSRKKFNYKCPKDFDFHGLNIKKDKDEIHLRRIFVKQCPEGYEVDHIIPKSRGGINHLSNLQWLPRNLNIRKRDWIFESECEFPHCKVVIKNLIKEKNTKEEEIHISKCIYKEKLALKTKLNDFQISEVLSMRKISVPFLCRKLKCSFSMAKEIIMILTSAT